MRDALSVEHHEIRLRPKLFPRSQHGRYLAKSQQAGDVGKHQLHLRARAGDRREIGVAEDGDCGTRLLTLEAHIDPCDGGDVPTIP